MMSDQDITYPRLTGGTRSGPTPDGKTSQVAATSPHRALLLAPPRPFRRRLIGTYTAQLFQREL